MWLDVFKPKPVSRSGYMVCFANSGEIGTGGVTVANTATTSVQVAIPRTKVSVLNIAMNWLVAAASASAVTVQVFKVSAAGVSTALTAAVSIKNDILTGTAQNIALAITSTLFDGGGNATRVIDGSSGDSLRVDVVAAGTVTTQPTLLVSAELAALQ